MQSLIIAITVFFSSIAFAEISNLESIEGAWECDGATVFSIKRAHVATDFTYKGFEVSSGNFKGLGVDESIHCINNEGLSCQGSGWEEGDLIRIDLNSFTGTKVDEDEELVITVELLGVDTSIELYCQRQEIE